jgi:hypothetical protein
VGKATHVVTHVVTTHVVTTGTHQGAVFSSEFAAICLSVMIPCSSCRDEFNSEGRADWKPRVHSLANSPMRYASSLPPSPLRPHLMHSQGVDG